MEEIVNDLNIYKDKNLGYTRDIKRYGENYGKYFGNKTNTCFAC